MKEYINKINQKILFYISLIGIMATIAIYIYSLFIPTNARLYLIIPSAFFAYLFCLSQKANPSQQTFFVGNATIITFLLINFTDFYVNYHYTKNDWKAQKGLIDYIDTKTKHSPDLIHYHFYHNTTKYESTKEQSIMLNFGFREADSIYVVYSKSNPFVNDIYSIKSGPNLHDRENFLLYFIKNNSMFKWAFFFIILFLLYNYLMKKNNDSYFRKRNHSN